ncbi:hypothetical protein CARUB_v10018331mg [Capsella rubella]|uniref:Uncharacterized protein n=1 Tax=Capsella rubella TaxID=81985 RepID=R0H6Y3_9BRAS|nr:hypothetical protein CARUB_v10018331mg [Capsella rubella]
MRAIPYLILECQISRNNSKKKKQIRYVYTLYICARVMEDTARLPLLSFSSTLLESLIRLRFSIYFERTLQESLSVVLQRCPSH